MMCNIVTAVPSESTVDYKNDWCTWHLLVKGKLKLLLNAQNSPDWQNKLIFLNADPSWPLKEIIMITCLVVMAIEVLQMAAPWVNGKLGGFTK